MSELAVLFVRRVILGWLIGQILNHTFGAMLRRQLNWLDDQFTKVAVAIKLQVRPAVA